MARQGKLILPAPENEVEFAAVIVDPPVSEPPIKKASRPSPRRSARLLGQHADRHRQGPQAEPDRRADAVELFGADKRLKSAVGPEADIPGPISIFLIWGG